MRLLLLLTSLPLLSILALDFAGLFSSVAVVEVAFSMPGLGADLLLKLGALGQRLAIQQVIEESAVFLAHGISCRMKLAISRSPSGVSTLSG